MANDPARFDVVVTPNLYGDIVSDVAAEVAGSVGMVGSANIGTQCAMFEAIHGSAPDIAGQNIANPSGLLHAAVMMLDARRPGRSRRASGKRLAADRRRRVRDGGHGYAWAENPRHIIGTHAFARAVARSSRTRAAHVAGCQHRGPASRSVPINPPRAPARARRWSGWTCSSIGIRPIAIPTCWAPASARWRARNSRSR
jgi:isocitrate dehydrogenase